MKIYCEPIQTTGSREPVVICQSINLKKMNNTKLRFKYGKHRGRTFSEVRAMDPNYLIHLNEIAPELEKDFKTWFKTREPQIIVEAENIKFTGYA